MLTLADADGVALGFVLTLADADGVALGFVLTLADADGVALGFVLALADADGIALGFALTLADTDGITSDVAPGCTGFSVFNASGVFVFIWSYCHNIARCRCYYNLIFLLCCTLFCFHGNRTRKASLSFVLPFCNEQ